MAKQKLPEKWTGWSRKELIQRLNDTLAGNDLLRARRAEEGKEHFAKEEQLKTDLEKAQAKIAELNDKVLKLMEDVVDISERATSWRALAGAVTKIAARTHGPGELVAMMYDHGGVTYHLKDSSNMREMLTRSFAEAAEEAWENGRRTHQ